MKNVLLICNYKPQTGGISGQVELLSKHLTEEYIENEIFSLKGNVFFRIKAFFRLYVVAKKYEVLHIHGCSGWGFLSVVYGVIVGKILKKRIVVTYHGGGANEFFSKYKRLVKYYLCKTDANIVLSGFLGNVFEKFHIPYVIIPNIIELDDSVFRKREAIRPCYVSIRTLAPLYNIECIIRAFQKVKNNIPEATLTIVGDGPSKIILGKMVADNHINDVSFVGKVSNREIYKYLDHNDIMLSAPCIDNMPVSVLEGFNAGLLVISSNVGGVPFMIEDGVNGLLFESDNDNELAVKMMAAVKNSELTKKIIIKAHNNLCIYSWNNIKTQLFTAYTI